MLELIIENKFSLQLPEDISIQFIEENPLLITDRIPSLYSLNFEISQTPYNLKAFGFPNRISSNSLKIKVIAEIRHSGLIIARGELILLSAHELLEIQFIGSRYTGNLKKLLSEIEMGGHNYGSFPYNQYTLDYSHPNLSSYVTSMREIARSGDPYVIAPVRTIKDAPEYDNQWCNLFNEYINFYNPSRNDFTFNHSYASQNYFRMPILPFPYLKDVISIAFGDFLENNPFESHPDLSRLVIVTMNHRYFRISKLLFSYPNAHGNETNVMFPLVDDYITWGAQVPLEWKFQSFMQNYLFSNLLKDLMKIFCMTTFPGIKYRIEFNNEVMSRKERVDWDSKIAGKPKISIEPAKKYVFKYAGISASDNKSYPDRVKEKIQIIFDVAYDDTESEGEVIYKDDSTGGMYKVTRTLEGLDSTVALRSEILNDPLSVTEEETDEDIDKFDVTSQVRPASMNILGYREYDITTSNPQKHWFAPVINDKGLSEPPYIMFWAGMLNTLEKFSGDDYPGLMAHHTDHLGIKHFNTSLHPEGPQGIIEKFHGSMKAWVEKDKLKVKASFRLTLLEIIKLKISVKIHLHGRLFYIEKLDYSLTKNGISLIEADLIEC
jgi:hypothetical protein